MMALANLPLLNWGVKSPAVATHSKHSPPPSPPQPPHSISHRHLHLPRLQYWAPPSHSPNPRIANLIFQYCTLCARCSPNALRCQSVHAKCGLSVPPHSHFRREFIAEICFCTGDKKNAARGVSHLVSKLQSVCNCTASELQFLCICLHGLG
jgi:hypothetical protein